MQHGVAIVSGLVALLVAACGSSSSSDNVLCTSNGGACVSTACGSTLQYPCGSGGVCCKVPTAANGDD